MSRINQNKAAEIKFFDNFGEVQDYDRFTTRGYRRIMNEFIKRIGVNRELKVADFGCGTGAFIARFRNHPFKLYGIDISSKMIEYAKIKYPQIQFKTGDVEKSGYDSKYFDVIFLSGILHHFPDFRKVIAECHRVLKPGGFILAYDPHYANPLMWLYRVKKSPFYSSKGVTENEQPLAKSTVKAVLMESEFKDYEVYSISGITYQYIESDVARLLMPIYNMIEIILDFKPLRKRFGSFLITYARKKLD